MTKAQLGKNSAHEIVDGKTVLPDPNRNLSPLVIQESGMSFCNMLIIFILGSLDQKNSTEDQAVPIKSSVQ